MIDPAVREDGELEPALELTAVPSLKNAESAASPEGSSVSPPAHVETAPHPPPQGERLSPNQRLFFTTLFGVTTVASLIALASSIDLALRRDSTPIARPSAAPVTLAPPTPRPKRVRTKLPSPWRIEDAKDAANTRIIDGQIADDSFLVALKQAGVEQRESYRILTALKGARDFDHCKRTDRFRVLMDRNGPRVRAFEYIVGPGEVYQAREGEDGLLRGAKLDLALAYNQVAGSLVYDGTSFEASADFGGFDPGIRRVVAKALSGHMALSEIERGDRIRLVAQELTVLGDFVSYEGVEAIEVLPASPERPPLRVYYFDHPLERGYYNSEAQAPYDGGWRRPIKNARVTSGFNLRRVHPILKRVVPHLGIDFAAPPGTAVGAAASGTVSFVGYAGRTGNFVRIDHGNQIQTGYAHLSRFAEGLKVGDRVKRLQVIGYVGSTGRSTGPHLHFSAKRNQQFLDPASLKLDAFRTLSKESRETFNQLKARYDGQLDALPLPRLPDAPVIVSQAASAPAQSSSAFSTTVGSSAPVDSEPDGEVEPSVPNAALNAGESTGHLTDKELLDLSGDAADGDVNE